MNLNPHDIAGSGRRAGRDAAEVFDLRKKQGTHEYLRRTIPRVVAATKTDMQKLEISGNEFEKCAAEYWLAFFSEFESAFAGDQ